MVKKLSILLIALLNIGGIAENLGFPHHVFASCSKASPIPSGFDLRKIPIGLKNLRNTCYMNSVIQSLYNSEVFHTVSNRKFTPKKVGWELKKIFVDMATDGTKVDTKSIARCLDVDITIQEDAEEFLLKLLDKVDESTSADDASEKVSQVFDFNIQQTINCTNIKYSSTRKQKYSDISVDIGNSKSLAECVDDFFAPVILNGDNKYKTPSQGFQDAVKHIGLSSLPKELIVHLKRFAYDASCDCYSKVLTPVDIPLTLNLTKHMVFSSNDSKSVYDISSIIVHDGDSLDYGHYYTLVRKPSSGGGSVWYKINDHIVTLITEQEALAIAKGVSQSGQCSKASNTCTTKSSQSASAYLVFYSQSKDH